MPTTAQEMQPVYDVRTPLPPYLTIAEFHAVTEALPDTRVELIRGELCPFDYFTLSEYKTIAEVLPNRLLELLNGEIVMSPPPDKQHQKLSLTLNRLLRHSGEEIEKLGCEIAGATCAFEVPEAIGRRFANAEGGFPSALCPDNALVFFDYFETQRQPPALLAIEVLSFSKRAYIERDLITKAELYATLEIPTYWVVDRRDQSVWVHTLPRNGQYVHREHCLGHTLLAAPGLEFLQLTPAQIFAE